MSSHQPFSPQFGSGISAAAGAASAQFSIASGSASVCITSRNNVLCYVRIGEGSITATAADYPIPPNQQVVLTKDLLHNQIAVIAPAGGGDLHIMVGEGY
jgi:hypothetical protein